MPQIRSAQVTLNALKDGQTMVELAQAFHDACEAVMQYNKAATITLKIEVAPIKSNTPGLKEMPIVMIPEVSTKLPKELPVTVFYVDDEGPTQHMSARQTSIPGVGLVDKTTGEVNRA